MAMTIANNVHLPSPSAIDARASSLGVARLATAAIRRIAKASNKMTGAIDNAPRRAANHAIEAIPSVTAGPARSIARRSAADRATEGTNLTWLIDASAS